MSLILLITTSESRNKNQLKETLEAKDTYQIGTWVCQFSLRIFMQSYGMVDKVLTLVKGFEFQL